MPQLTVIPAPLLVVLLSGCLSHKTLAAPSANMERTGCLTFYPTYIHVNLHCVPVGRQRQLNLLPFSSAASLAQIFPNIIAKLQYSYYAIIPLPCSFGGSRELATALI